MSVRSCWEHSACTGCSVSRVYRSIQSNPESTPFTETGSLVQLVPLAHKRLGRHTAGHERTDPRAHAGTPDLRGRVEPRCRARSDMTDGGTIGCELAAAGQHSICISASLVPRHNGDFALQGRHPAPSQHPDRGPDPGTRVESDRFQSDRDKVPPRWCRRVCGSDSWSTLTQSRGALSIGSRFARTCRSPRLPRRLHGVGETHPRPARSDQQPRYLGVPGTERIGGRTPRSGVGCAGCRRGSVTRERSNAGHGRSRCCAIDRQVDPHARRYT